MRNVILIFSIFLFNSTSAQTNEIEFVFKENVNSIKQKINDIKVGEPKGPIKILEEITYNAVENFGDIKITDTSNTAKYEFDFNGFVISELITTNYQETYRGLKPSTSLKNRKISYDNRQRPIRIDLFVDNKLIQTVNLKYDANDNLIEWASVGYNKCNDTKKVIYEFDANNNKTRMFEYFNNQLFEHLEFKYTYDSNNNIINAIVCKKKGNVSGYKLRESQCGRYDLTYSDKDECYENSYNYDFNGRVIQEIYKMEPNIIVGKKNITYSGNGDVIEELYSYNWLTQLITEAKNEMVSKKITITNSNGDTNIKMYDEKGELDYYSLREYLIDSVGNWVKETGSSMQTKSNYSHFFIKERRVIYY